MKFMNKTSEASKEQIQEAFLVYEQEVLPKLLVDGEYEMLSESWLQAGAFNVSQESSDIVCLHDSQDIAVRLKNILSIIDYRIKRNRLIMSAFQQMIEMLKNPEFSIEEKYQGFKEIYSLVIGKNERIFNAILGNCKNDSKILIESVIEALEKRGSSVGKIAAFKAKKALGNLMNRKSSSNDVERVLIDNQLTSGMVKAIMQSAAVIREKKTNESLNSSMVVLLQKMCEGPLSRDIDGYVFIRNLLFKQFGDDMLLGNLVKSDSIAEHDRWYMDVNLLDIRELLLRKYNLEQREDQAALYQSFESEQNYFRDILRFLPAKFDEKFLDNGILERNKSMNVFFDANRGVHILSGNVFENDYDVNRESLLACFSSFVASEEVDFCFDFFEDFFEKKSQAFLELQQRYDAACEKLHNACIAQKIDSMESIFFLQKKHTMNLLFNRIKIQTLRKFLEMVFVGQYQFHIESASHFIRVYEKELMSSFNALAVILSKTLLSLQDFDPSSGFLVVGESSEEDTKWVDEQDQIIESSLWSEHQIEHQKQEETRRTAELLAQQEYDEKMAAEQEALASIVDNVEVLTEGLVAEPMMPMYDQKKMDHMSQAPYPKQLENPEFYFQKLCLLWPGFEYLLAKNDSAVGDKLLNSKSLDLLEKLIGSHDKSKLAKKNNLGHKQLSKSQKELLLLVAAVGGEVQANGHEQKLLFPASALKKADTVMQYEPMLDLMHLHRPHQGRRGKDTQLDPNIIKTFQEFFMNVVGITPEVLECLQDYHRACEHYASKAGYPACF